MTRSACLVFVVLTAGLTACAGGTVAPLTADTHSSSALLRRDAAPTPTPSAVVPGQSVGEQFGPGGNNGPKVDHISWTLTVNSYPFPKAYYYFALEYYWQDGIHTGYFGLQPNGNLIAGGTGPIVGFGEFGSGPAPLAGSSPNCTNTIDGGPGLGCQASYPWSLGHKYKFDLELLLTNGTQEAWGAWVTDTNTSKVTFVAWWSTPESWGYLNQTTVVFDEYYVQVASCAAWPYASAQMDVPTTYYQGTAYAQEPNGTPNVGGNCPSDASGTKDATGILAQTGLGTK